jgi:hypothetical protein
LSLPEETRHNGTIWQNWDSPSWQTVGAQYWEGRANIPFAIRHLLWREAFKTATPLDGLQVI